MPLCPPVVSCCSLPLRVFAPLLATFSCHRLPLWVMFSGRLLPFPLPCHVCAAQLSSAASVPPPLPAPPFAVSCVSCTVFFCSLLSVPLLAALLVPAQRVAWSMFAVLARPLFFSCFAGRRFFALSFCTSVLRPASLYLLVCFVFSLERSQRCLLALPLVYFCQGVA